MKSSLTKTLLLAVLYSLPAFYVPEAKGWLCQACQGYSMDFYDPHECNDTNCPTGNGSGDCGGMTVWWVSEPLINLRLEDEPLGYQPAIGPRVSFHLSYRQRGALPDNPSIFGVGPNWTVSFRAFFSTNSTDQGGLLHEGGAGWVTYTHYSAQGLDRAISSAIFAYPGYQIQQIDGSVEAYQTAFTDDDTNLMYFLTYKTDPAGNRLTYHYTTVSDGGHTILRLDHVTDAENYETHLYYENASFPNLITRVEDPYSRTNFLLYDAEGYLTNSTDVAGLVSSFQYDAGTQRGFITNLATPYGNTGFKFGGVDVTNDVFTHTGEVVNRYAEITLPTGGKHLYLYQYNCSALSSWSPAVPTTTPFYHLFDTAVNYNDSFHWGPLQYAALGPHDPLALSSASYAVGRLRHWLVTYYTGRLEAIGLERAPSPDGTMDGQSIWYGYRSQGTISTYAYALFDSIFWPSHIARVLPDGSTQFTYSQYGTHLNLTNQVSTYTALDGSVALRTNAYLYAANTIDLLQWIGPQGEQVVGNYYDPTHFIHRPDISYDALNQATYYTYNGNGQLTSVKNPAGLTTTNYYFDSGASIDRLSQTVDVEISRSNSFTYYDNGLVATHTDERGLTTTRFWDNLQRLTGAGFPDSTTISNRYRFLDLSGTKDRLGNWTYAGYNSIRQKIAETNANGVVTGYMYCDCGLLFAITNAWNTPSQLITTFGYDYQANRLFTDLPDATITYVYDAVGHVVTNSDAWGSRWFGYNNQGLLVGTTNAFGTQQAVTYDIEDRPIYVQDANQVTVTNTFDVLGRLTTRLHPDGGLERAGYSARGLIAYTNQISATNFYAYDEAGRMTVETNANWETIRYTNNAAGDLLSLTDGKNQTTRWNYDVFGHVTNKLDQAAAVILTYKYDANNRLTNRWSAAKGNTGYSYDAVGNLTFINYPTSPDVTYQYDPLNRLTNMVDAVGTTKFTYASGGELYTEDGPFASDTITNLYTSRLRTGLKLQQPTGLWTNGFGYDTAKRITGVTSPAGTFGYIYDASRLRLPVSLSLPNGSYITNQYDGNARLLSTKLKTSGATVLDEADYGYNAANQRTAFTDVAGTAVNYAYDPIGQLKVADSSVNPEDRGYLYDAAWNLNRRTNNGTATTLTVDGKNQLSASGTTTFQSDDNGNLTRQSLIHDLITDYAYDDENQLVAVLPTAGRTTFVYDGLGRLRKQLQWTASNDDSLTAGQAARGGETSLVGDGGDDGYTLSSGIYYIYDGNRVIQERDADNNPTVSYTRGKDLSGSLEGAGGIGGLLARSDTFYSGNFTSHAFYHADGNGNITYLVDGSQGLAASYRYDAFGNLLNSSGPLASDNTYRFSSKEWVPSVNGYYYLYRFYRPDLQRWLNRDPIEEIGGINLYNYVENDPIGDVDPFGLQIDGACTPGITQAMMTPEEEAAWNALLAARRAEAIRKAAEAIQKAEETAKRAEEIKKVRAAESADDKLKDLEKAQQKAKDKRPNINDPNDDWDGAPSRPKQNTINRINRTEQKTRNPRVDPNYP